jgi:hypothetical protein
MVLALVCSLLPARAVLAATPAELVGPDLEVQPISLTSLRGGVLHYFDANRNLKSSEVRRWVQLRVIGGEGSISEIPLQMLWLTDGQRFSGRWMGPTPDGEKVRWQHPLLGLVVVPLEDVAKVHWSIKGADQIDAPIAMPASDTVVMTNGDALKGFISTLAPQGVALVPLESGRAVTIPYGRIRSMTLASPARQVPEPYQMVTLTDGTRAWADQIVLSDTRASWRFIPPGSSAGEVDIPIGDLSQIDFQAGGFRLIELVRLPMRTVKQTDVFGLTLPVRVDGRSIYLHAPAQITFDLPAGASGFAASAELDTTEPVPGMDDWPDFHLVVLSEGTEVGRVHLSGSHPTARIRSPVSGPTLTIRLDAGINGPILDRLRLRDAVVLIRPQISVPSEDPGP